MPSKRKQPAQLDGDALKSAKLRVFGAKSKPQPAEPKELPVVASPTATKPGTQSMRPGKPTSSQTAKKAPPTSPLAQLLGDSSSPPTPALQGSVAVDAVPPAAVAAAEAPPLKERAVEVVPVEPPVKEDAAADEECVSNLVDPDFAAEPMEEAAIHVDKAKELGDFQEVLAASKPDTDDDGEDDEGDDRGQASDVTATDDEVRDILDGEDPVRRKLRRRTTEEAAERTLTTKFRLLSFKYKYVKKISSLTLYDRILAAKGRSKARRRRSNHLCSRAS